MAHLTIYGPADALDDLVPEVAEDTHLSWQAVQAGDRWSTGRYEITAVPATHGGGALEPLLYVIAEGDRRLFYATDTAPLSEPAWDLLRYLGAMDVILLDATSGERSGGNAHHGLAQFTETRARMIDEGVLLPGRTRLYAHHFSHNGHLTHSELVDAYGRVDAGVAYDGLEVTV
jgi:phosphoribosyl 1,2-cyclic phosphate phosphodiesterase